MTRRSVINVSGPYGVGKDSVLRGLAAHLGQSAYRLRTVTTRHRSEDADPTYAFCTDAELDRVLGAGRWIVNSQLASGVRYATSLDEAEVVGQTALTGLHSIFAGPDGAGELRRRLGSRLYSIGLLATGGSVDSELEELDRRMEVRGRETEEQLAARRVWQRQKIEYVLQNPTVSTVDGELPVFDVVVVNRSLDDAIRESISLALPDETRSARELPSDAQVYASMRDLPHLGGSYFEEPEKAVALGRVLCDGDFVRFIGEILPPATDETYSYFVASSWSFMQKYCLKGEYPFALFRRPDGRLLCPMLYSRERLMEFLIQIGDGLKFEGYVALQSRDIDGFLSA